MLDFTVSTSEEAKFLIILERLPLKEFASVEFPLSGKLQRKFTHKMNEKNEKKKKIFKKLIKYPKKADSARALRAESARLDDSVKD